MGQLATRGLRFRLPGGKRLVPRQRWLGSAAVLLLLGVLGWSALPSNAARQDAAWRLRDPLPNPGGIGLPVFVLRADGAAVRFGDAEQGRDGVIRVGLYDSLDPLLAEATETISLPGDLRLMWLLAAREERQQLRDRTSAFAAAASTSALAILRAPEFATDYREPLLQLLRAAVVDSWQAARASGAWQDLMHGYEPIISDEISRELRPLVVRRFQNVPLRLLGANAATLLDFVHGPSWNTDAFEQAVGEVLRDIRDRSIAEKTALRLLDTRQTAAFLRVFITAIGDRLMRSTELQDLLAQMIFDERLQPYTVPAVQRAIELARIAPRLFVSVRAGGDLNLVASLVARNIFAGRQDRVVVLMSAMQRRELAALDAASVHPLQRMLPPAGPGI